MKKYLTWENAMGAVIIAFVCFLAFVLPVLVGEAPPAWTGGGLAVFVGAHMAGSNKQKKGRRP